MARALMSRRCAMTIELKLLLWSVALAFAQMLLTLIGAKLPLLLAALRGKSANMPELSRWAARAAHAQYNMIEALALFVPLVLIAEFTGRNDAITAVGAGIFFFARLIYAFVCIFDVPYVRTSVWAVSAAGLVMIFTQLV
jgi:uncharacterized MAPEG superfamily protein